jgi:RNA polymerase sigma factor (sigma-70 family)
MATNGPENGAGTGSENDMPTNGTCPGNMTAELIESVPDGDAFGITIRSRAYHADLLAAARVAGGVQAMARYLGVSESTLGNWIRLDCQPRISGAGGRGAGFKPQRWAEIERKLVELTGKGAARLWPGFLKLSGLLDAPKVREETREIPAGDLMRLRHQPEALLPPPERNANLAEAKEALEKMLATLSYREREILKLRHGLGGGGGPHTLEEVGRIFKITKERVRSLEARAIDKLRGGPRCVELARLAAAVFDLHPCPRCGLNVGHFSRCALCDGVFCDRCVRTYRGRTLCPDCRRKRQEAGWPEAPDSSRL